MATHHGSEGSVYVSTNKVAEVTSFDYDEDARAVENTECGDAAATYSAGIPDGTGRISCMWDPSDTDGQNALREGETATLHLCPTGKVSQEYELTGSVLITRFRLTQSLTDMERAEIEFKGILTEQQVP
jgi:hypothetical protein